MLRLSPLALCLGLAATAQAGDIDVYFNHPVNPPAVETNLEQVVIDVIDAASSSLDVAIYDLDLPGIANALKAARQRGVTVRVITDEDNIGAENQQALAILEGAGIPWIDDTENGSAGSKIQHNKFIVVDGRKVLTGSTNFTQSGIHGDLDAQGQLISAGNLNHMLVIQSQQLAGEYAYQFNQMWGDGQGGAKDSLFGLGKQDHQLTVTYTDNDNIKVEVQFTPQSPTLYAGSTLANLEAWLKGAEQRIEVAQFAFSAQVLADAMQVAQGRGAEIRGVGDSSFFYRYFSEFQDMAGIAKLNDNGEYEVDAYTGHGNNPWPTPVEVYAAKVPGGDKLHHKFFVIDNMVVTGSHNASGAAAFGNDENLIAIHDANVAAQFHGAFERMFCEAKGESDCAGAPLPAGGTWEGVTFTGAQVQATLELANTASQATLDDAVALDSRAAGNIVAARPIADMDALAAIGYVGSSALTKLRDYQP
ncbi:phospholipase D-like domain-containing protein [Gallaecimonas sp. GXIMD4217]|uniref:phospholipase D-like domain-containing protein n=1 Tax=Gallaecimonas sp. GXIMD4217 TaxID=3131927 RepID=UPI00311B1778